MKILKINLKLFKIEFFFIKWPSESPKNNVKDEYEAALASKIIGLSSVIAACFTSGFGGVYFEKILKNSASGIWIRNIQLGFFGTLLALFGVLTTDYSKIIDKGFFQGYNNTVWLVISLQVANNGIRAIKLLYF